MAIIGVSAIGAPIDWCMSVSLCRSIVSDGGSLFTTFLWEGWDAGVLLCVFFLIPSLALCIATAWKRQVCMRVCGVGALRYRGRGYEPSAIFVVMVGDHSHDEF